MFEREEILIGKDNLNFLKEKHIIVLGAGGVGGYVIESLARCGIGHLTIIDYDSVDITNINRQIIALHSNIGKKKVDCFKERIKDINPNCYVNTLDIFYKEENKNIIFNDKNFSKIKKSFYYNYKEYLHENDKKNNLELLNYPSKLKNYSSNKYATPKTFFTCDTNTYKNKHFSLCYPKINKKLFKKESFPLLP